MENTGDIPSTKRKVSKFVVLDLPLFFGCNRSTMSKEEQCNFDSPSGFEIPTYLLAKCKPKLENASWNFKQLLKNLSANYWRTVTECTKFHMWIQKKVILFVLDKHQSCITENTLRRLLTILHVAIEASELSFIIRISWGKCVRLHSQSILRFCVFCTEKQ